MNAVSRERSTMGALESFVIDHNSGLPVWIQIKNRIAYLIGSGAFVPGDRLPTVRALAVDLDISYNTVNRAYMDLEREGYIGGVRAEYNALSAQAKSLVTNYDVLVNAENTINQLKAQAVIAQINSAVASGDAGALQQARNAYNGLSQAAKGYVSNYQALLDKMRELGIQ